jgi:PPK2 family polyphosphate:nucleotide phosphotransferase
MVSQDIYNDLEKFKVVPGRKIDLAHFSTDYNGTRLTKQEGEELLELGRKQLAEMQDKLYAHNRFSILIILQAMDAAGKDGAVKHILSGVNPLGVKIHSFKAPTAHELDHHFLWRHTLALPARGEIAIHNRSHYENVLVTRVHPEYILRENLPGIDSVEQIDDAFWESRFKQISRFEDNIVRNGTIVLKFFLHLSKKEQKKRLLSRIDDPSKNWKFDVGDLRERERWGDYQKAYEEMINATSMKHAPWWFTRLAIAAIIHREIERLELSYPRVSEAQQLELKKARMILTAE